MNHLVYHFSTFMSPSLPRILLQCRKRKCLQIALFSSAPPGTT